MQATITIECKLSRLYNPPTYITLRAQYGTGPLRLSYPIKQKSTAHEANRRPHFISSTLCCELALGKRAEVSFPDLFRTSQPPAVEVFCTIPEKQVQLCQVSYCILANHLPIPNLYISGWKHSHFAPSLARSLQPKKWVTGLQAFVHEHVVLQCRPASPYTVVNNNTIPHDSNEEDTGTACSLSCSSASSPSSSSMKENLPSCPKLFLA